jgi:hypothetical protein
LLVNGKGESECKLGNPYVEIIYEKFVCSKSNVPRRKNLPHSVSHSIEAEEVLVQYIEPRMSIDFISVVIDLG